MMKQYEHHLELTILMPCLNEAETLAVCIKKAPLRLYKPTNGVYARIF
ncbi:MAG: hypothetical protein LBH94_02465 [Deltaproteobacteria bacterium]|jgi:hypothetical protein|nr:hypothetical protein [Deltaproteobacteria bacterium]